MLKMCNFLKEGISTTNIVRFYKKGYDVIKKDRAETI